MFFNVPHDSPRTSPPLCMHNTPLDVEQRIHALILFCIRIKHNPFNHALITNYIYDCANITKYIDYISIFTRKILLENQQNFYTHTHIHTWVCLVVLGAIMLAQ